MTIRLPVRADLMLLLSGVLFCTACPADRPALVLITSDAGYAEGAIHVFPGLAGVPNYDDDNGNGDIDWDEEGGVEDDNERSYFFVETPRRPLKTGETIRLEIGGDASEVRIYDGSTIVLGEVEGPNLLSYDYDDSRDAEDSFAVEFRHWLTRASLTARRFNRKNEEVASSTIYLTASPVVLNHHLQQTDHTWVVGVNFGQWGDNDQMVSTYAEVLGDLFTEVNGLSYQSDVWIQDEVQFATMTAPDQRNDLCIDSIRDRGLDDFAEDEVEGPDFLVQTWGEEDRANAMSMDSFGNLEVSPPLTVDGVHYPFGRIYYGNGDSVGRSMVEGMRDFLDEQLIQEPFTVDTGWLCVGHIDEYTSFVPDPTAPKGFRFIYADTQAAWDVLEDLPTSAALAMYGRPAPSDGHGLANVGAFVNNNALRGHNEEVQEDILDPVLDVFKEELGLDEEDILYMPSLFEEIPGCGDAALIPGMANLIVANVGDESQVFLADPFLRNSTSSNQGQEDDPMIAAVEELMPDGLELNFVDDWDVYHMSLGEVHCGTNMTRTPMDDWWSTAGHLIEAPEETD